MDSPLRIVILGAGPAGATVASALSQKLKENQAVVTVVDSREVSVHKPAGARAAVLGDRFAFRACVPNNRLVEGKGSRVIHARVVSVNRNSVSVETGEGQYNILPFDYLVCATGAENQSPCEPPLSARSSHDIVRHYSKLSKAIRKASKICILGSGAVGAELAGEIKEYFPQKGVAVISPSEKLVDNLVNPVSNKFHKRLANGLSDTGVEFYLQQKVRNLDLESFGDRKYLKGSRVLETTSGLRVTTDLVIKACGITPNSGVYPAEWKAENNHLKVDLSLLVVGTNNVFAVGDVNDIPENKQFYLAQKQALVAAQNLDTIVRTIWRNRRASKPRPAVLVQYSVPKKTMILVSIGPKKGVSYTGHFVMGSSFTTRIKARDLYVQQTWALYKLGKWVIAEGDPNWYGKMEALLESSSQTSEIATPYDSLANSPKMGSVKAQLVLETELASEAHLDDFFSDVKAGKADFQRIGEHREMNLLLPGSEVKRHKAKKKRSKRRKSTKVTKGSVSPMLQNRKNSESESENNDSEYRAFVNGKYDDAMRMDPKVAEKLVYPWMSSPKEQNSGSPSFGYSTKGKRYPEL